MKIVKFDNGKWALRKFSVLMLGWIYKDLATHANFWWTKNSASFKDCLVDSEEEVRRRANLINVAEKVKV